MTGFLQTFPAEFYIAGIAHAVGSEKLTNADLLSRYSLRMKASFIDKSIGIETRYFAGQDQASSDLAASACAQALEQSATTIDEVDRLIVATSTPDHQTPSTACIVQHKLGGRGFPANDIVAACSGFVYGLDQALRCLATGDETVLLVGVDCRSRTLNMQDKRTVFLYGDGAAAVVLKRRAIGAAGIATKLGFLDCLLMADGEGHDAVYVPAGGSRQPCTQAEVAQQRHKLRMPSGERVAKNALQGFLHMSQQLLERNQLSLDDIDQIIFHQPNKRLLEIVMKAMQVDESKAFINFQYYGNTVAASIPLALSEAFDQGRINPGDKVMLCAVGGGFTGGAALLQC